MQEWIEKRKTMHHYDHLASTYDTLYSEEQGEKMEAAINFMKLAQDGLVLDLGCGTGLLFQHVAKLAKVVIGLDVSSKMLHEGRRCTEKLPNATVLRADADHTPFQNQTFDQVFAVTLLQNMPDSVKTIQEIRRVSKPQSTIIISGMKKRFTREQFIRLLSEAGLKVSTLKTNPPQKAYIAVCKTTMS